MKKIFPLFFLVIFNQSFSQEQRALIIGIDKYNPPAGSTTRSPFADLDGCKNDALSIYSIITSRFNFPEKNIHTLYDENATRTKILEQMNQLKDECKQGDIAFIYYAGHGSQVLNKKSKEPDQKDESMVPADYWKEGVQDIRDKELAAIFNSFLDKGIRLTVIMDCCHSGSMSRGPGDMESKVRYMADPSYFVEDPSSPEPPETRPGNNFLIISASQDNELAAEQADDNKIPHGAFTIALTEALRQQSADASALDLFTSLRAIIKSNGKRQEPAIAGSAERQQQTLFGLKKGIVKDRSLVAVSGIYKNTVELQGGFALGLYKESELTKFNDKDSLVIVRIDSVLGVNKSIGSVIKGSINDLSAGNFMEITNWTASGAPLLKLYIPENNLSDNAVNKIIAVAAEIKKSGKVNWVNDLEKTDPYTSIYFEKNNCFIKSGNSKGIILKDISAQNILSLCKKDSSLYFELPPSKNNAGIVKKRLGQNKNFRIVNNAVDANYTLYGTTNNDVPAYGLRKTQVAAKDSLESMPLRTKAFTVADSSESSFSMLADSLYLYSLRLSKLRGWLQMAGPQGWQSTFPYQLGLFDPASNTRSGTGAYKVGQNVSIRLVANEDYLAFNGIKKYIYVFAIDKDGAMILCFPAVNDGNQTNQFPKYDQNKNIIPTTVTELFSFTAAEPTGTDNYFLLATDEAIPSYSYIFNQSGVKDNNAQREVGNNPLADLFDMGNEGARDTPKKLPRTWSLQKFPFKCTH